MDPARNLARVSGALVEGGKLEIFTPMYLVVVRKKKAIKTR